ncbi:putative oxidoreductase C736,13 [Schizosaccharomyces pombe 972h-] [Rhizoctonia solani]|uniref:Putative oxidoreductase C736,13 [Schizosaccharomyces pombe 972h-] n=1 Tax=Rhizoctonia solani TaxID=456999 RepID=A0A0K6GER6_9AGAM|nr:putative oxidoreductase C736,13 [Schizosaccharomyces pombe 972h-] [Rhizoctonia solani]
MGNVFSQSFPPKSLFTVEQIPDLTGQVIIVTGGNTGIGKETCKALLNKNAKVYLAARNRFRADTAIEWLKRETNGKTPIFLELDLANLASVRKAAEEKEQELHVLFNNAGVMGTPTEQRTVDGYDLQFGTNVIGHYFFTTLLLPTLSHTAKNSSLTRGHTRVINTSSSAVYYVPKGGIIWETLGTDASSLQACKALGPNNLYYQSKLGNVLFSNELAKRYAEQGIISSSLNPGNLQTELLRHVPWLIAKLISLIVYPASYGALTQLWSGTMAEGENDNGKASPFPTT